MPKTRRLKTGRSQKDHYVFPYIKIHGRLYPLIPVGLSRNGKKVNTFALLDSGASISVFRPEISKALGIKKTGKSKLHLGTASGGVNIEVSKVDIKVGRSHFPAKIGFSHDIAANFNILGREGFFHRFSICFNEIMKTVILVPLDHKR